MTDIHNDSKVISIVTHDLKTPVTAARGFLDLVQNVGPLSDGQKKWMTRAFMSLDRMEQLITMLSDWSHLEEGRPPEMTQVDLTAMIHSAVEMQNGMATQRNIDIHLELGDEPVTLRADEHLMGHVVTNLLSNAIKYNRDDGDVWVRMNVENGLVSVEIEDTGIGIAKKDQAKVFERFYRASRKGTDGRRIEGTGLGLAIAKTVVEIHQGEIWLKSKPKKGSTFGFNLPNANNKTTDEPVRESGGAAVGRMQAPAPHASGEIIDNVDDDLQERPENPERETHKPDEV